MTSRRFLLLIAGAVLFSAPLHAHAQSKAEQALSDWRYLAALHREISNAPINGGQTYRIDRTDQEENFKALIAFVADRLEMERARLGELKKRNGGDPLQVEAAIYTALDFKARDRAGKLSAEEKKFKRPASLVTEIEQMLPRIEKAKTDSIAFSLKQLRDKLAFSPNYREDIRVKELLTLKMHLETLARYEPSNAEIAETITKVDAAVAANQVAIEKAIANHKFPMPFAAFGGPGQPADLATEAVKYFRGSPRWTGKGETIVACVLLGDWFTAAKHPITEQPIRFGLPMAVALVRPDNPKIAWVYEVHMLTAESLTPSKSAPFVAAGAVISPANPSMMLTEKIPADLRVK